MDQREKSQGKFGKHFEMNGNKYTTYQILWNAAKVLGGKLAALNTFTRKEDLKSTT